MSEVIGRITLSSSRNFEIKRSSSPGTDFYPFLADGSNSLYAGDQLKVPQGQNVWVKCLKSGQTVKVPNNGIPWAVTMAC